MPSLADSAVIFILALMLFGPKKLPQLARQLGKLMAEFRRASNEFRMQMEDELRIEEQKEHEAKVSALPGPETASPGEGDGVTAQPFTIAECGDLKMRPPETGLPVENTPYDHGMPVAEPAAQTTDPVIAATDTAFGHDHTAYTDHAIPEHDIPEHTIHNTSAGISSEEPREEQTHA